jgi:branched-chain amino acid transport system substrate-binding protein
MVARTFHSRARNDKYHPHSEKSSAAERSSHWRMFSVAGLIVAFILPLFVQAAQAQTPPIKLGFIFVLSGRLATFGTMSKQGAELAIEQINETGGINGRKLVGIFEDSHGSPELGAELFKKMVNDHRVDVVIGPSLSNVALSISPLASQLKMPLIVPVATAPELTGTKCNRYTFRIGQSLEQNIKSAAIIARDLGAKKWTTVGPDYVYGHQGWELFKKYLKELRPGVSFVPDSQAAFASPETPDWTDAANKVKRSDADGVLVTLFAGNLIDFVKQAQATGLLKKKQDVVVNLGASTEVLYALKQDMPTGIWLGAPYWFQNEMGPGNHNFVAGYRTRFKAIPSWNSAGPYSAVRAYVEAVKVAGSTRKEDVIKALEGLTVELPVGSVTIRKEDHQAVTPGFWGKTADDAAFRFRILKPLRELPGSEITPSPAATGCRMPQ